MTQWEDITELKAKNQLQTIEVIFYPLVNNRNQAGGPGSIDEPNRTALPCIQTATLPEIENHLKEVYSTFVRIDELNEDQLQE